MIAVEPVPLHFQYLEKNVAGLPVICLNVSLAVQLPKISNHDGSIKYGSLDEIIDGSLDVPVMQLTELMEKYEPTVIKLNCEGCEHYVLEELSQILRLGVKKIAVQFHDIKGRSAYESLVSLEEMLGNSKKTAEKWTTDFSGKKIKTITVYWEL